MPARVSMFEREWDLVPTIIRVDRINNLKSPTIASFFTSQIIESISISCSVPSP